MRKLIALAAIMGCAALAACGGDAGEETVNVDNGMMMENLDTTTMDMNADMNMDMNADMNADMNTDANMTGNTENTTGNSY
jgi:hypothetical protein